MTDADIMRELMINRVLLLVIFFGLAVMFATIGMAARWSIRSVTRSFAEFELVARLLIQWLKSQGRDN